MQACAIQPVSAAPRRLLRPSVAATLAISSGLAAYVGACARPELVHYPFWDCLIGTICMFALFTPLLWARRSIDDFFSPEVMGGLGFLVWIGMGTMVNLAFPGESVNPEILDDLPWGMAAQTLAAVAFFFGARAAARNAAPAAKSETNFVRLSAVMAAYGAFCLYIGFFMPRFSNEELYDRLAHDEEVPMLVSAAPVLVLQTVSLLVAAAVYYRNLAPFGFYLAVPFAYNVVLTLSSGARREAVWSLLALLSAYIIAKRKFSRSLAYAVCGVAALVVVVGTAFRMSSDTIAVANLASQDLQSVSENVQVAASAGKGQDVDFYHATIRDIVYHCADAHTMAYLLRNNDCSLLLGEVTVDAALSALPRPMRPYSYQNPVILVVEHFRLYKQPSADSGYCTDWETSISVWGYADFGWVGVVVYPLALGFLLHKLYHASVLSGALGPAGWVVYIPFMQQLWFLHNYGPACPQVLRFLAVLAILGMWCAKKRRGQRSQAVRTPTASETVEAARCN